MRKLSLRARAALFYFANSDMSISAARLAEEVAEGRDAIRAALKELRDAGLILTRKERVNNEVKTVSYVTEEGFLEASSWGLKSRPQIQHSMQNSTIHVLANSAINIKKVTIAGRLEEEKMGYEFFESTSSVDADERESERLKAEARRRQEYNNAKLQQQQKNVHAKESRTPETWAVKDSMVEFASRMKDFFQIPPWNMAGTRFFEALGASRKKYGTNGLIEKEMMEIFFTTIKLNKESDGDKLWKLFIARYSELATQAKERIVTPEKLETAKQQSEDSWKGL